MWPTSPRWSRRPCASSPRSAEAGGRVFSCMARSRLFVAVLLLAAASSCTIRGCGPTPEEQEIAQADPANLNLEALPESQKTVIVFLGDSLTAGSGLLSTQAFPALI